jgi:hypothetical protein
MRTLAKRISSLLTYVILALPWFAYALLGLATLAGIALLFHGEPLLGLAVVGAAALSKLAFGALTVALMACNALIDSLAEPSRSRVITVCGARGRSSNRN